jgi:hypothetical protein
MVSLHHELLYNGSRLAGRGDLMAHLYLGRLDRPRYYYPKVNQVLNSRSLEVLIWGIMRKAMNMAQGGVATTVGNMNDYLFQFDVRFLHLGVRSFLLQLQQKSDMPVLVLPG